MGIFRQWRRNNADVAGRRMLSKLNSPSKYQSLIKFHQFRRKESVKFRDDEGTSQNARLLQYSRMEY